MRIPKFLISLHQKIKHTRVWKHRWKIVATAPFALAFTLAAYYIGYRMHAEKINEDFVESWHKKGESLDINQLIPEHRTFHEKDDFFSHPAILSETRKTYGSTLSALAGSGIKGVSSSSSDYINPHGDGTYATGHKLDITQWLDPKEKGISEPEAARKLLTLISSLSPRLDGIVEASHRKHAWYPRDFDQYLMPKMGLSENRFTVMYAPKVLGQRAMLHLVSGNETKACSDYSAAIRVAKLCCHDNNLIGYLVGAASLQALELTLWEGLSRHLWSEQSLAQFEHLLQDIDEESRFLKTMRQEVAYTHHSVTQIHQDPSIVEKQQKAYGSLLGTTSKDWKDHARDAWLKIRPRGWFLKNGTKTIQILDETIFYPAGTKTQRLSMNMVDKLSSELYPLYEEKFGILNSGDMTMHFYGNQIVRALKTQATINNMRTAIALERFRLKNNRYPEQLSQLVPNYLPSVLEDVITRKPLIYRIKTDGTPLLYSIGANQRNNQGKPNRDANNGDWTWMYSPPPNFKWSDYRQR